MYIYKNNADKGKTNILILKYLQLSMCQIELANYHIVFFVSRVPAFWNWGCNLQVFIMYCRINERVLSDTDLRPNQLPHLNKNI